MEQVTCIIPKKIKLLVSIVKRGDGEKIAAFYRAHGLTFNMISPGYGAAGLEILDYLGLTETEKDIVISIVSEEEIHKILPLVKEKFKLKKPDAGIVFTIPIVGVSGSKALNYAIGFGRRRLNDE
ncbi:MAG: hypothetical protein ACOX4P_01125 [Anaerovoracaceae bacterium]|jgi:hypothetical protein